MIVCFIPHTIRIICRDKPINFTLLILTWDGVSIIIILAISFCFVNAFAEPSAKVTANVGNIKQVDAGAGWVKIMENDIKTANAKDLFVDVSLDLKIFQKPLLKQVRLLVV